MVFCLTYLARISVPSQRTCLLGIRQRFRHSLDGTKSLLLLDFTQTNTFPAAFRTAHGQCSDYLLPVLFQKPDTKSHQKWNHHRRHQNEKWLGKPEDSAELLDPWRPGPIWFHKSQYDATALYPLKIP